MNITQSRSTLWRPFGLYVKDINSDKRYHDLECLDDMFPLHTNQIPFINAANQTCSRIRILTDNQQQTILQSKQQKILNRQLEEELRLAHELRVRSTDPDIQHHIDALCHEKEALYKENCMLRDTIRELEMRLETQKQTLAARDDSIKKMVEMMNNKGIATKIMEDERLEMDKIKSRNIELETRLRHFESIIEAKEKDIIKVSRYFRNS